MPEVCRSRFGTDPRVNNETPSECAVREPLRLGVFGGTFDPIHCAHLAMARAAAAHARLDRVLFVVSGRPPHKTEGPCASAEERFDMVRAALADEPRFEAVRIEIDRPGPSYTVDTLAALEHQFPGAELFLILGMDSLADLSKWRDPEGIVRRARILAIPRAGWTPPPSVLGRPYMIIPFPETSLSSTEVRARIAGGRPVNDVIPPRVLDYIRKKGIYHAGFGSGPRP